jgi:hypothetical protein
VLAVARPVAAGEVIELGDLREVRVSADPGLRPMPAAERGAVVGRVASADLAPGTLLTAGHVSGAPTMEAGRAQVGVAVKAGQAPADLRPGDRVLVVLAPDPTVAGPSGQSDGDVVEGGRVTAVAPAADGSGATVVTVEVAEGDAAAVATASLAGRVGLVRVAGQ